MVRHSVVVVALLCASGMTFAQTTPDAHANWQAKRQQWAQKWQQKRAAREQTRMDRLGVLLDMTPAQKRQVQAILATERSEMRQAMKQAMQARRTAHTEIETKLGQVLSSVQMSKLKLLMQDRHRFMMRGMGRHGMCGRMHGQMGMWKDHGPPPPPPGGPGQQ